MGVRVRFWKGSWWLFINRNGRRRAKKVGDRNTAIAAARRIRERFIEGELGLPTADSATFASYADKWLGEGQSAWKRNTHRFYEFNLKLHILPMLGHRNVSSLRRCDCRDLLATARSSGLKRRSLAGVNRTLSAVLSQAVEDELLPANPCFRMGRHLRYSDEGNSEVVRFMRPEEVVRLLDVARQGFPVYHAFLLCAVRTGLRLGELLGLQWSDIDFHERALYVRRSRTGSRVTTPKNRRGRRVDMSLQLTATLEALRAERREATFQEGRSLSAQVFLTPAGIPIDGDNIRRRVFQPLLERAGLPHFRIQDLRHTFASLLIQNGESLKYVQEQMGHSSIQVTADVYGHLIPGSNKAAVDRLDATFCNPGATSGPGAHQEMPVSN